MKNLFIPLLFVLVLLLSCSNKIPVDKDDQLPPVVLQNTKGKVLSADLPLQDVVVTDGTNFTTTDSEGRFELPFSSNARFVYISSPTGYSVPVERSVPMYWKDLRSVSDRQSIVFTLDKVSTGDDKHLFVAIGDPQVRNNTEIAKLEVQLRGLKAALEREEKWPTHLMVAGDIVFDRPEMHETSKASFAKVGLPSYYTIGNHDYIISPTRSAANDAVLDSNFMRHYGPTYYSFNKGKVHYIVLDNIVYEGGTSPVYRTEITQKQLAWVAKDLQFVPKDRAIVVMFHAPSKSRYTGINGNSADLYKLFEGYAAVHLISGHTHYNSMVVDQSGIIEHNVGAICGGFWEGPVCLDGTPLGYKVFRVNGTDLNWEYITTERPGTQFTVFKPDASRAPLLPPAEEFLVNVWDWEPTWKVEYSEDQGATFKVMSRYNEQNRMFDPTAYYAFGADGETRVVGRSWIDANKTDHLFHVIPSIGTKSIVVRVQTRFKTYTETVIF